MPGIFSLPKNMIQRGRSENMKHKKRKKIDGNISNRITVPIIYPNKRYKKTNISKPSEANVEYAKDWVDFNKL